MTATRTIELQSLEAALADLRGPLKLAEVSGLDDLLWLVSCHYCEELTRYLLPETPAPADEVKP